MSNILLIGTGGTISCVETEHGLSPKLTTQEILSYTNHTNIDCIDMKHIDSSLMRNSYRMKLARFIFEKKDEYSAFIISHGTDTLAYTAAFLDISLQNFKKPIILVGSQKPISFKETDAIINLSLAINHAKTDACGVYIATYDKIINAKNATKISTSDYIAFSGDSKIFSQNTDVAILNENYNENVGVLTITPNLSDLFIEQYSFFDKVIVLSFGSGGMLKNHITALEKLSKNGTKIYIRSVCTDGIISKTYTAHRSSSLFTILNDYSLEYNITRLMFGII